MNTGDRRKLVPDPALIGPSSPKHDRTHPMSEQRDATTAIPPSTWRIAGIVGRLMLVVGGVGFAIGVATAVSRWAGMAMPLCALSVTIAFLGGAILITIFVVTRKSVPPALLVVLVVGGLVGGYGMLGVITGMIKSFDAVGGGELIDPSEKARMLAEGISEAMNCMAFLLLVMFFGGIVVLGYWLVTRRRRTPREDGGGDGVPPAVG